MFFSLLILKTCFENDSVKAALFLSAGVEDEKLEQL